MNTEDPPQRVERLFPFVLRSRALIVGRESLQRSKSRLQFILMTRDISDNSREEVLADFAPYPIVQCFAMADLEKFFRVRGAKVIGFEKSGLSKSIYTELKDWRVNKPAPVATDAATPPAADAPKPDTESSAAPVAARPRARWNQAERDARRLRK